MVEKARTNHPTNMSIRLSIIKQIVERKKMNIPNDVLYYLAEVSDLKLEEIESAIIRIIAISTINNQDINLALATEAINELKWIEEKSKLMNKSKVLSNPIYRYLMRGAIVASIGSVLLLSSCSPKNNANDNSLAAEQTKQEAIQQDTVLRGIVEPYQIVTVAPAIPGNIKEINYQLGDYVKSGEKLAQLDEGDVTYRIKQAEAHVKMVEVDAQVKAIEQQISLNHTMASLSAESSQELDKAIAAVKDAEINLNTATTNWNRMKSLYQAAAISQQQMEQATSQRDQAENQLNQAKSLVSTLSTEKQKQKETATETSKLQQNANSAANNLITMGVEQAKADLELIRYQYNNLSINAPISGFITQITGMVGSSVSPQTPLFSIANMDQVYIIVGVPEAIINRLKVNQSAKVTIPTLGKTEEGKITFIGQMADKDKKLFPVRVLIDNAKHELKGGMTAQVEFSK